MPLIIALLLLLVAELAGAATLADQVAGMTPGNWTLVVTDNAPASVDPARSPGTSARCLALRGEQGAPCPNIVPYYSGSSADMRSLFGAWNGGAWMPEIGTCGAIAYVGGGHTDYFGNQVVALDLCGGMDGAPTWRRLSPPFNPASSASTMMLPDGSFPDGSMSPSHTYGGVAAIGGKLVVAASQSCRSQGLCGTVPEYAPDAWVWDGTWHGPIPHAGAQAGAAAADTLRGVVWAQPDTSGGRPGEFMRIDPTTMQATLYGRPNIGGSEQMMGYDPDADRLVLMAFGASPRAIYEKDPANPTAPWATATQINKPPLSTDFAGGHAMAWSPRLHAWVVFMGNVNDGRVWKIERTAPLTYTWSLLSVAGATPPVTVSQNGLFGKFQVFGTDAGEVLIGTASLTGGVWAFRIPGTELVRLPCGSPGVFVCESFAGAPTSGKLVANAAGNKPVVKDGALVFTVPSGSGPDAGGRFELAPFPPVGEGGTIAWSYRVKADAAMAAMPAPGWKQFTLYRGTSPCTDLEVTVTHRAQPARAVITPYTECGNGHFYMPIAGTSDLRLHYPDRDCRYRAVMAGDYSRCAVTVPGEWQTYYFEVKLGTYGQPNSRVVAWERTGGQWQRFIERSDFTFNGSGGFDHFMLTVYMTGKDPAVVHAPGTVQYDNLVLARAPFFADLRG